ncbi:MAG: hypothetical protein ABIH23_09925 [bacterium]
MKLTRILTVLTLVLLLVGGASAQIDNPFAHYEFDKDASDSSGNACHDTLVGDANIPPNAERGNVLSLDGDGDYVSCSRWN